MPYDKQKYDDYLLSSEWYVKKQQTFKRDGHRCRKCYSEKNLKAHHKTYQSLFNENLDDLITLCGSCHSNTHDAMKKNLMENIEIIPLDETFVRNAFKDLLFEGTGEHLKEQFVRYNRKNPMTWVVFVYYAAELRKVTPDGSAKQVVGRCVWEYDMHEHGKAHVNNSLTALYSRMLAVYNPIYASFFKFRTSPGKKATPEQKAYKKLLKKNEPAENYLH